MNTIHRLKIALMLAAACLCSTASAVNTEKGVSKELAEYRAAHVTNVRYTLNFSIPDKKDEPVTGTAVISFAYDGQEDLPLDFQGEMTDGVRMAVVNGQPRAFRYLNEHIIIDRKYLRKKGKVNQIVLFFVSSDNALNRNDEYLYTLFVPDHARSAFPCFDQPDLKATFTLTLQVPDGWTAISNGNGERHDQVYRFQTTKPIPTYLFSFTAGKFSVEQAERDGRTLTLLYRETDPKKVAQIPTVFNEIALSLRWMEDYTGIGHPFEKYACVALPGYQFGGMEHPGCIQFRDATIFLGEHPTPDEEMNRLNLIAHETSHLWFGNLVTMRWFDDVWTKEVFANFMADKIARQQFPKVNHDLNFIKTHYIPALATDRTEGTHPIQQPLDNLNQAGLLYGNIVYHKAPIMMRKLEERMGEDGLREGLKQYLRKHKYGNSSWNELISILDSVKPSADIKKFDREWVKSKGVKTIEWDLSDGLPNPDGTDYARYLLRDSDAVIQYINEWTELKTGQRQLAAIMTVHENWLAHRAPANMAFTAYWMLAASISNEQVLSVCAGYINELLHHLSAAERPSAEKLLFDTYRAHPVQSFRQKLLRGLSRNCISQEITDSIYAIWKKVEEPLLNERDRMRIAYHLMINKPNRRQYIYETQLKRLSSEDRRKEFEFISQGCSPDTLQQWKIFESLLQAENRKVEPYAAELLALLANADRGPHVEQYVGPGLEIIEEIQRTGDIFFPLDWCGALLYGQRSKAAAKAVTEFLNTHPDLSDNLRGKIQQAAFPLLNRFY